MTPNQLIFMCLPEDKVKLVPALAYATATSASRLMLASLSIVPSSCSMPENVKHHDRDHQLQINRAVRRNNSERV